MNYIIKYELPPRATKKTASQKKTGTARSGCKKYRK